MPRVFRQGIAISAFIVLLYAAGWVSIKTGAMISQILFPLVVGVLLAALLMPVQLLLNHKLRFPRYLGAATTIVGLLLVIGATIYFAGRSIMSGIDAVTESLQEALDSLQGWLANGPMGLNDRDLHELVSTGRKWVEQNTSSLSTGALNATSSAGALIIGALLALIIALFVLAEGDRICSYLLLIFKEPSRTKIRESFRRSWVTLGSWARTQVIVSGVDAIGIGVGAAILGLPFVIPMMVLTFLLCFIPLFGAVVSGAMFTLLALVFKGPIAAIIMLAVVIAVQQLESNLLQPLLMGRAVNLHPLVVLLGVTTGTFLLGLTGALLAVPVLASVNAGYAYWAGRDPFPGLAAGHSALKGSPRHLIAERKPAKLPAKIGEVTPRWMEQERRAMSASPPVED